MALPKRRSSRAKVRTRRQHWKAKVAARTICPHCQAQGRIVAILPHRYCPRCKRYGELTLGTAKEETPRRRP